MTACSLAFECWVFLNMSNSSVLEFAADCNSVFEFAADCDSVFNISANCDSLGLWVGLHHIYQMANSLRRSMKNRLTRCFQQVGRLFVLLAIWQEAAVVCGHIYTKRAPVVTKAVSALYPAMFTFGDSLVDIGNNNFLATLARADFPPNGVDFGAEWPTGRFCNGHTVADYIGYLVGIDPPPAYLVLQPNTGLEDLLRGVNFASGAAGILDESGYNYLERIPMSQQLGYFATLKNTLVALMGEPNATSFLNRSLYLVVLGSNDYINNYLLPGAASRELYTPKAYQDLLVNTFLHQIKTMYQIGARKIAVTNVGPLGCIPIELYTYQSPNGSCIEEPINAMIRSFNLALKTELANMLRQNHTDLRIVYVNAYDKILAYSTRPAEFGFVAGNVSCCGQGNYGAEAPCIPTTPYCADRSAYVFWDRHHPTDRANLLLATAFVSGPPADVYPVNLAQLAAL